MANQTGIAINIKAWLPVTGSISEQIAKLQMVEAAHASGDYAELLKTANVEDIKTEQKTRRMEDNPSASETFAGKVETQSQEPTKELAPLSGGQSGDEEIPDFLKSDDAKPKKSKAA